MKAWILLRALFGPLGAGGDSAAPASAADEVDLEPDAPESEPGLGDDAFDLAESFRSEEHAAATEAERSAEAARKAGHANRNDEERTVVLEDPAPEPGAKGGETDTGAPGATPAGSREGAESDLPQIGEPDRQPSTATGAGGSGEDEPAALRRLATVHPNTPESALKALRAQEQLIEQTRGDTARGKPAAAILERLAATPLGKQALARVFGLVEDAPAGGSPAAGTEGARGAPAPDAAADPAIPQLKDIQKLLTSTDPDEHLKGLELQEKRASALQQQRLDGFAKQQRDEFGAAAARNDARAQSASEIAKMDRILGPEWQGTYLEKVIATTRRAPGLSLAEAIIVNATGKGDWKTVKALTQKGQQERTDKKQFAEGSRASGQDSARISDDERRYLRGLGALDLVEPSSRGHGGRSTDDEDAGELFDI